MVRWHYDFLRLMVDVKSDIVPNDEFSANYLVSYAVNLPHLAQIWLLGNSGAHYQPPDEGTDTPSIPTQRRY